MQPLRVPLELRVCFVSFVTFLAVDSATITVDCAASRVIVSELQRRPRVLLVDMPIQPYV